ncbi:hypothetical protein M885DRAFT_616647 [Pelagophyceae sp. CCMP2097]|nr:hypothetical protein M885DRAFT_616647 [Pelagophyceae sp. CCMP2097]
MSDAERMDESSPSTKKAKKRPAPWPVQRASPRKGASRSYADDDSEEKSDDDFDASNAATQPLPADAASPLRVGSRVYLTNDPSVRGVIVGKTGKAWWTVEYKRKEQRIHRSRNLTTAPHQNFEASAAPSLAWELLLEEAQRKKLKPKSGGPKKVPGSLAGLWAAQCSRPDAPPPAAEDEAEDDDGVDDRAAFAAPSDETAAARHTAAERASRDKDARRADEELRAAGELRAAMIVRLAEEGRVPEELWAAKARRAYEDRVHEAMLSNRGKKAPLSTLYDWSAKWDAAKKASLSTLYVCIEERRRLDNQEFPIMVRDLFPWEHESLQALGRGTDLAVVFNKLKALHKATLKAAHRKALKANPAAPGDEPPKKPRGRPRKVPLAPPAATAARAASGPPAVRRSWPVFGAPPDDDDDTNGDEARRMDGAMGPVAEAAYAYAQSAAGGRQWLAGLATGDTPAATGDAPAAGGTALRNDDALRAAESASAEEDASLLIAARSAGAHLLARRLEQAGLSLRGLLRLDASDAEFAALASKVTRDADSERGVATLMGWYRALGAAVARFHAAERSAAKSTGDNSTAASDATTSTAQWV